MAKKGKEKNTKNKAKHSRLMTQKKNKAKAKKEARVARLKEIINAKKLKDASESE